MTCCSMHRTHLFIEQSADCDSDWEDGNVLSTTTARRRTHDRIVDNESADSESAGKRVKCSHSSIVETEGRSSVLEAVRDANLGGINYSLVRVDISCVPLIIHQLMSCRIGVSLL